MGGEAIKLEHITKVYKLYNRNRDRLKDSLGLTRKKCYTEHYALRDVSMEVQEGEMVGIIGVNGSGKSTILKIITGVLSPSGGTMQINGRISALLELGAGFNMDYTGIENVYMNGTMMGFSREEIDARLQDILDFADIGDFVYQPVKSYSSGMFVRLAFAVAINIDPEILIVDEALSVGDVFFQAKCYRKFEEFKAQGRTILFVSHDLSSIARYCDRVILLNFARDLLVDEQAVLDGIESGKIRRYVTDFPNPVTAGKPGCIVIPHLGASTEESEENCAVMAVKELRDFLENGNIKNSVNYPNCDTGACVDVGRVTINHKNIPNMISQFTKTLGDAGVNISNMTNKSKGDYAYTMIDVSSPISKEVADTLKNIKGVYRVRIVK